MSESETLAPCPNQECRCPIIAVIPTGVSDADECYASCTRCGTSGPVEDNPDEAVRLWNALPRRAAGVDREAVDRVVSDFIEYLHGRADEASGGGHLYAIAAAESLRTAIRALLAVEGGDGRVLSGPIPSDTEAPPIWAGMDPAMAGIDEGGNTDA